MNKRCVVFWVYPSTNTRPSKWGGGSFRRRGFRKLANWVNILGGSLACPAGTVKV
jgi:hypothetical protein